MVYTKKSANLFRFGILFYVTLKMQLRNFLKIGLSFRKLGFTITVSTVSPYFCPKRVHHRTEKTREKNKCVCLNMEHRAVQISKELVWKPCATGF
jgi:hypothetical protein